MSLLFMDGFDHYAVADMLLKWTNFPSNGNTAAFTTGRFGTAQAAVFNNNLTFVGKLLSAPQSTLICGFAFKINSLSNTTILGFYSSSDSGYQVTLNLNSSGQLGLYNNGGTLIGSLSSGVVTPNTWCYIEVKITFSASNASNTCIVRVNGANVINIPAGNVVRSFSSNTADTVRIGLFANIFGPTLNYDDLYVCNNSGTLNADFLGDSRIETLFPNGAGNSTQFTIGGSSPAATNWQSVNETTENGDTTYVSSSTAGQIDEYAMTDLASTAYTIYGIQSIVVARKDDAGTRTIAIMTRSGGTDYTGSSQNIGTNYNQYSEIRETDPATSAAWNGTNVNALQVGFQLIA